MNAEIVTILVSAVTLAISFAKWMSSVHADIRLIKRALSSEIAHLQQQDKRHGEEIKNLWVAHTKHGETLAKHGEEIAALKARPHGVN